jgi:hypothetical protein
MAATEKKTYLIDFKDNLPVYAQRAADAKKEVDKLKAANKELNDSGKATAAQIEKANSALRTAQQEYKNATKNVDLATKANKANKNSYEELYRQWQLAQTQLKLMGDGYSINSKGVRVLNADYVRQRTVVANAKASLDAFGKSVHDNRLNVGSYSEALEGAVGQLSMMPGFLGTAGTKLQAFIATFSKMGMVGAIIAGVGAGLAALAAPLISFYKWNEEGIHQLEQRTAGWKASLNVFKGDLIKIGQHWNEELGKQGEQGGISFAERFIVATKAMFKLMTGGAVEALNEKSGLTAYWKSLSGRMNEAEIAAINYTKAEQELAKEERAMLVPRAQANLAIKEARLLYADTTKSYKERYDALETAINKENEQNDIEVKHQQKVVANLKIINAEKEKVGQLLPEDKQKLAEAEARVYELQSESAGRLVRASKSLATARAELAAEAFKLVEAETKLRDIGVQMDIDSYKSKKGAIKYAFDALNAQTGISFAERAAIRKRYEQQDAALDAATIEKQKQLLNDELALQIAQLDTVVQNKDITNAQILVLQAQHNAAIAKLDEEANLSQAERDAKERTRKKKETDDDIKAGFARLKILAEDPSKNGYEQIDALNTVLDLEYGQMLQSVEYEQMTSNEKLLIDEQYTQAKAALSRRRVDISIEETKALSESLGSLAAVFAEHTAAHKFFAIAQALIDTYLAAAQAMADWSKLTVVEKIAAVGAVLAQGFSLVNAIRGIDAGGKGTGSSGSLASAPATNRVLAQPVGASSLQPSASQQANAAAMNSGFNFDAMVAALGSMPAPIVTVEDINAKAAQKQKVEVAATV